MSVTKEQARTEILGLMQYITTRDKTALVDYLLSSSYFSDPSSVNFHENREGGLAIHSYNVFRCFTEKVKFYNLDVSLEEAVLVTIFHDLCKVGTYAEDDEPITPPQVNYLKSLDPSANPKGMTKGYASKLIEWLKSDKTAPRPEFMKRFKFVENLPLGHGEKSAIIFLRLFPQATDRELCMIRHHQGPYGAIGNSYNEKAYNEAVKKYPCVVALSCADYEAGFIVEKSY